MEKGEPVRFPEDRTIPAEESYVRRRGSSTDSEGSGTDSLIRPDPRWSRPANERAAQSNVPPRCPGRHLPLRG